MKSIEGWMMAASLVCLAAHPVSAKKIRKSEVPAAVTTALKNLYPKAKVSRYLLEEREGRVVFEIETKDGDLGRDLVFSEAGEVLEKEEGMSAQDLPEAVKAALRSKYPQAVVASAERITKGGSVSYEVSLRIGKKKREMAFDGNGVEQKAGG